MMHPRYADPKRLVRYSHQSFTQNGEDGILAEIFRRIGSNWRTFLEIGVGDGLENNTVFLLSQGWKGWWVEASQEFLAAIQSTFASQLARGELTVVRANVTAENVGAVLEQIRVPRDFDLLSIDVDQNTYWIWAAFKSVRPRVMVVEYNASFPPNVDWNVEYRPEGRWDGSSYFGASLKALELLGASYGYSLVGCELMGVNTFFVRNDLCGELFAAPFTTENHNEPPRYGLIHRQGHRAGLGDRR